MSATGFMDEDALLESQNDIMAQIVRLNGERALRGLCWLAITARRVCPEAATLRLVVSEVDMITEQAIAMTHSLLAADASVVMALEEPETDEAEDAAAELQDVADTLPDAVTLASDHHWNNRKPGSDTYGFVQFRTSCGEDDQEVAFDIDIARVVDVLAPRVADELQAV